MYLYLVECWSCGFGHEKTFTGTVRSVVTVVMHAEEIPIRLHKYTRLSIASGCKKYLMIIKDDCLHYAMKIYAVGAH